MTGKSETTDHMAPFKEGLGAGLVGADPRVCPYDKMTKEWDEWQRGQAIGVGMANAEVINDER